MNLSPARTVTRLIPLSLGLLIAASSMATTQSALVIDASKPPAADVSVIPLGTVSRPDGAQVSAAHTCLLRDGKPWLPVMGEFHYSRYPQSEWRDELLKMKAGGIDIVASYVFWIHHEETEGQFDWTGQRDLRAFVQLCKELDLPMIVRCGPWDHGEVRNGGFPDWLLDKGYHLRSDDPKYLAQTRILYQQIAEQLKGLLWKDGGPVVGIQVENEYNGPAAHLLTLKKMAVELGLDVPIYTRTGWPMLRSSMPFGELLPLYGGYGEGFWDRDLTPMPGKYWKEFTFQPVRTNATVGTDATGNRQAQDEAGSQQYPYLTCELGAGMMPSYHRRILFYPQDAISNALVKIGSGSNLPGYYMYHGGTNPDGKTWLNELQATRYTNYNDLPVKTYDFQAPLGEFGQIRPQYHLLRRLHMFLHDFGDALTAMSVCLPDKRPADKNDTETVRWSVRSDGKSGYVFVNNHQRDATMPAKPQFQIALKLASGDLTVPQKPLTIPADGEFYLPFNLDMAGARLIYATAQPICRVEDRETTYFVFAPVQGTPSEFAFEPTSAKIESTVGSTENAADRVVVSDLKSGTDAAIRLETTHGKKVAVVLLDESTSLACWKGKLGGRDRIFLSRSSLTFDSDNLGLRSGDPSDFSVAILPAPSSLDGSIGEKDGVFQRFTKKVTANEPVRVSLEQTRQLGPPRTIPIGQAHVAASPTDADFDQAAVWKLSLPPGLGTERHLLLRIHYIGDVARAYLGEKLLTDNFYNGNTFDVGVNRSGQDLYSHGLTLKILPLRKDVPIYFANEAKPDFGAQSSVVGVGKVEAVEEYRVTLRAQGQ